MLYKSLAYPLLLISFPLAILSVSCKGKDKKETISTESPKKNGKKKDSSEKAVTTPAKRPPVINITDTVAARQLILYVKDSAASSSRISAKLASIYAFRLPEFIGRNKLKITGSPMAWYKAQQSPFFFEAGLPIDKKPAKLPKGFFIKSIGGDSVVVAHFYGPYEMTSMAYEALNDFFKSHKKKRASSPYEVYVADPYDKKGKQIDPYKVQTDIIFPYK